MTGRSTYIISFISRLKLPALAILMALAPALAEAQTGGFAGSYTRMGFGPRGMSAGNVLSGTDQQGIFAHYNPALSAYADGNQIDFSSALMAFDRTLHGFNATFPLPPQAGLSVGLLNANVSNIDGRSSSGYDTGEFSTNEFQLVVAFGLNISERLKIGTSVKAQLADFHEEISAARGVGFDVGIIAEPLSGLKTSLVVQDLLSGYTWNTEDLYGDQSSRNRSDDFPTRFKFGLTYESSPAWFVGAEFEIQRISSEIFRRNLVAGGPVSSSRNVDETVTSGRQLRFGGGYRIHERITARTGFEILHLDDINQSFKPSAGFSLHLPFDQYNPTIDYAWVREPTGIAHMHVLALQINL